MRHDPELDHYSDQARAECEVCSLRAERDRLRAAIEPLRPYRVAIRANDPFFESAPALADAILRAVAALDAEGETT